MPKKNGQPPSAEEIAAAEAAQARRAATTGNLDYIQPTHKASAPLSARQIAEQEGARQRRGTRSRMYSDGTFAGNQTKYPYDPVQKAPRPVPDTRYVSLPHAGGPRGIGQGAAIGRVAGAMQRPGLPSFDKSVSDYMAELQASGMFDSEAIFGNQEADLQRRAAEGDTRIAAIYNALNGQLQANDPAIAKQYADSQAAIAALTAQTAAASQQGYTDANASVAQTAANLGTQASGAPIAASGTPALYQGGATSDIAERGQVAGLGAIGQSDIERNFNRANASAALTGGAGRRASLQSDLLSQLAALADKRASAKTQSKQSMFGIANDMYDRDYSKFRDERNYTDSMDDRAYSRAQDAERFKYQQQMDAAKMQGSGPEPTAYASIGSRIQAMGADPNEMLGQFQTALGDSISYQDYIQRLRENGVPPQVMNEALEFYKTYKGS